MASHHSIKIHEQCKVTPHPPANQLSLPLTFFDLFWLRFHPVERVFFYALPTEDDPSFLFYDKVVPNLKASLSLTLQHFLPLAGNIVWPSHSHNPFVQYTPGDGVSLVIAESNLDFNAIFDNSPRDAAEVRSFVPHLESSESEASVMSLQITLFPNNNGFSIGISTHHAVFDGKSSTMFIKAWAHLSRKTIEDSSSPSLVPELVPFFDREVVKDPNGLHDSLTNSLREGWSKMFPNESNDPRSLKILPFHPRVEDSFRATFVLTRGDLEKVKKDVLSKWDLVNNGEEEERSCLKAPSNVSSFVVTCGYVLVCMAKAIQRVEKEKEKFGFAFAVDCRGRLESPVPDNYFGNCVWGHLVDAQPTDFVKEDGVVLVAKSIHSKIRMVEKGVLQGIESMFEKLKALASEGVEVMGLAGSSRFGVYGIDFAWGRPEKVEIPSVDRGLTMGLAESKDGNGGVQVEVVLKKNVMNIFSTLFREGLSHD